LFRAWFYFRTGYGLYLAFLIGFASNIVVLYKLGVADNKYLGPFFPSLTVFALVAIIVATPVGILSGLYHMKRTGAFAADAAVLTESNPYVYRAVPGKEKEVMLPLMVLTARGLAQVMDQLKTMTSEERNEFEEVLAKADILLKGQAVGLTSQRPRDS
jgi:predicted membrane-bound mannosyltransferase